MSGMNADRRRESLLGLVHQLGLEVRLEPLDEGQGGLCRIGRRWQVLLDERAAVAAQADALLAAVVEFISADALAAARLDDLYLLPELRAELEEQLGC